MAALAAQRSMSQNSVEQNDALAKLSSGSRINKAADDAAGLAMSEKLKANIKGGIQATMLMMVFPFQTAIGLNEEVSNLIKCKRTRSSIIFQHGWR